MHSVEAFLQALVQRKCNFHLVFFEQNARLCIPENTREEDEIKYALARTVVMRHLQANLSTHPTSIKISVYDSYHEQAFQDYLIASGTYFLMAHDGASTSRKARWVPPNKAGEVQALASSKALPEEEDMLGSSFDKRRGLRTMLSHFLKQGYSIALVNGLEWRDTKIMTMVCESSVQKQSKSFTMLDFSYQSKKDHAAIATFPTLPQSQVVIVNVVRRLLSEDSSKQQLALALMIQSAVIRRTRLAQRRLKPVDVSAEDQEELSKIYQVAFDILRSSEWETVASEANAPCDLADLFDGRLIAHALKELASSPINLSLDSSIQDDVKTLASVVASDGGPKVDIPGQSSTQRKKLDHPSNEREVFVLPFSNTVFDAHLTSVQLREDKAASELPQEKSARIFKELTHWHNTKPLTQKKLPDSATEKQKFYALRSQQRFMAEMTSYAASLTNAVGKSLEPETIISGRSSRPVVPGGSKELPDVKANEQPIKAAKAGAKGSKKQAILKEIASTRAKKEESSEERFFRSWTYQISELEQIGNTRLRYSRAKIYLEDLPKDRRAVLEPEVELYLINTLLQLWARASKNGSKEDTMQIAALLWALINSLGAPGKSLTPTISAKLVQVCKVLGIAPPNAQKAPDRPLSFSMTIPNTAETALGIPQDLREFQLDYCGPYFDRSIDSAPDARVRFDPDGWQRKVLDTIDQDKSVLAIAPTSAGKTFISFYAMKKVLEENDTNVLVFLAPTKALVNQIAAEIQANYSKSFKYGGKSVWAIHTRDYRVNDPLGCQILVTVPHILQIMLMAPSNARSWAPRIKRIIFDEIHSIGQAEDGLVWEQLLLLAPCPIIALSATVGNPDEFNSWLVSTQKSMGHEMEMIVHPYRYSDLRKYMYNPPATFSFKDGLPSNDSFVHLGLDGSDGLSFMHPVASLIHESRGMPEDLTLEARDCLSLWKAMKKYETPDYKVDASLDPKTALPQTIRKVDIIKWETPLKALLCTWMVDPKSPFAEVRKELSKTLHEKSPSNLGSGDGVDKNDLRETTLPLLCQLHAAGALPAILFNYDRSKCETICEALMAQLETAETAWKSSSSTWKTKLAAFEQWKKLQEGKKSKKAPLKTKKKGSSKDDDDEKTSKAESERENLESETSPFTRFDPNAPVDGFHFANEKTLQPSEMAEYMWRLERRHVAPWLCKALTRGIGVHHAGMNRAYRQVVETLFRKGYLRVIIATGTLALGINMPCKTVVFSGDSVFLTALNFRQAAGRAGRRGFDLLGNVVFQNISLEKSCRLVSSRLPSLNGHFPTTTSLVLRLFILQHASNGSPYAERAINSLLSQPRLYLGGPSFKEQVLHHLRFSVEYLRRNALLDRSGAPINFAGIVSHLYYTENSSFAFHALLKGGYFHDLCRGMTAKSELRVLDTLMLTMAHLFGRQGCKQADEEFYQKVVHRSPSIVFLPRLPESAETMLREHNKDTLGVFFDYVASFAGQHLKKEEDRKLPLTGLVMGGDGDGETFVESLPPTTVRSAFVALSGHGDEFKTISELCRTARDGVFLEEAVIPYVTLYPDETNTPLNACKSTPFPPKTPISPLRKYS